MNAAAIYVIFFLYFLTITVCQLIVNVKNNGGDVYRENINANTTQDTVSLDFRKADGTLVTQFIDGKNEIQIFKLVILPEEERGLTQVQTICFISRFSKNEFISSDAMSKLRQKNPSAIRHPEEMRPQEFLQMDMLLNVANAHMLSPHIATLCSDAVETTYMSDNDLRLLSQILNRDHEILQSITHSASFEGVASCQASLEPVQPCVCHYDLCIGWYPCGLKYCRGKDSANRVVSYRCGIKTCSKCRSFEFLAQKKSLCVWDEAEFLFESEIMLSTEKGKALFESELNISPLPNVAKPALEREMLPKNAATTASTERGPTIFGPPVIKMEQKSVPEDTKKVPLPPQLAINSKPNVLGKIQQLDDDEDGE